MIFVPHDLKPHGYSLEVHYINGAGIGVNKTHFLHYEQYRFVYHFLFITWGAMNKTPKAAL